MISSSRRTTWLLLILGAVLLLGLAGSAAASPTAQPDDRPPNATTYVDVSISPASSDHGDISLHVVWETRYPARSSSEAGQAEDGTLDTSWFRGGDELADFATAYPDAESRNSSTQVHHVDIDGRYGEIHVVRGTTLQIEFGPDRERIVIGPQLAETLSDGDRLTVEIPHDWTPESATIESERTGVTKKKYTWRIGEGPSPRFVLNESGVSSESSGGALGLDPFVPVLAIVLATIVLTRKRWRRR